MGSETHRDDEGLLVLHLLAVIAGGESWRLLPVLLIWRGDLRGGGGRGEKVSFPHLDGGLALAEAITQLFEALALARKIERAGVQLQLNVGT